MSFIRTVCNEVVNKPTEYWYTSYTTGSGITGARLTVFRLHTKGDNPYYKWQYGDGHNRLFVNKEEAEDYAIVHGYTQHYYSRED